MEKWDVLCSRHTAHEKGTQITSFSYCLKILFTDCTENKNSNTDYCEALKTAYYQIQQHNNIKSSSENNFLDP